jgi:hypothetical protein
VIEQKQRWLHQARRATFEDYRRHGTSAWVVPHGISMRPLVGRDTWMLVEFGANNVRTGDIVVFPQGDRLLAHRVVARRSDHGTAHMIVKGDAEAYADPLITPEDVLGVVRALRIGKEGSASSVGCAGWPARLIATISYLSGRVAWLARRTTVFLSGPPRRLALLAIPPFTRVAAYTLFTPLIWAARFQTHCSKSKEGGEQHEAI